MEKKYYKKPNTKTVQLKIERLLQQNPSPATGEGGEEGGGSRELRSVWKDGEE